MPATGKCWKYQQQQQPQQQVKLLPRVRRQRQELDDLDVQLGGGHVPRREHGPPKLPGGGAPLQPAIAAPGIRSRIGTADLHPPPRSAATGAARRRGLRELAGGQATAGAISAPSGAAKEGGAAAASGVAPAAVPGAVRAVVPAEGAAIQYTHLQAGAVCGISDSAQEIPSRRHHELPPAAVGAGKTEAGRAAAYAAAERRATEAAGAAAAPAAGGARLPALDEPCGPATQASAQQPGYPVAARHHLRHLHQPQSVGRLSWHWGQQDSRARVWQPSFLRCGGKV